MANRTVRYVIMQQVAVPGNPVLGKGDAATLEAHEAMLRPILRHFQEDGDGENAARVENTLVQLRNASENPGRVFYTQTRNREIAILAFDLNEAEIQTKWVTDEEAALTRLFLGLDAN